MLYEVLGPMIDLLRLVNDHFSNEKFIVFPCDMMIGHVVILMNSDIGMALKLSVAYSGSIVALVMVCVPSQLLSNSNDSLFMKSYSLSWDEYPPKARLMLVMILVRTMKPMVLTAGSITELNFETCSTIIKSSLSFVAGFRSLYTTI